MDNDEVLANLINATDAINMIKDNLKHIKEVEENIDKKNNEINDFYEKAKIINEQFEQKLLQVENLLNDAKEFKNSSNDSVIKEIQKQIQEILSNNKHNQIGAQNNTQKTKTTNKASPDFVGKQLGKGQFEYVINEHFGKLADKDWALELNLLTWKNQPMKYDIRAFSPDHKNMDKGISLTKSQIDDLKTILNKTDITALELPIKDSNYEIIQNIGKIKTRSTWNIELNITSLYNKEAYFDLRNWSADHTIPGKGIIMNRAELQKLKDILNDNF